MIQGSEEWHLFRKNHIGSSDAPVIMGKSKFSTPFKLWLVKTGQSVDEANNWATQRGNEAEPLARALFEKEFEASFPPAVVESDEHPWMSASLDGYHVGLNTFIEIKCPRREVMELAKKGEVHPEYIYQLEHQLMVTKAEHCFFMCVATEMRDGKVRIRDKAIVKYYPNPTLQAELLEAEKKFWFDHVVAKVPPKLGEDDVLVRTDFKVVASYQLLKQAISKIKELKAKLEEAKGERETIEKAIYFMMRHTHEEVAGSGIRFHRLSDKDQKKLAREYKVTFTGDFYE